MCANDKVKGQNWMFVIFGLSGGTAYKTGMILDWNKFTARAQEHFKKSLPMNTVHCATQKCKLKLHHGIGVVPLSQFK